jgi:hypothetical protein
MRRLLLISALAALLVPTASHAQIDLGLRIGFAPAMGDAAKDSPMSDGIKSQIPIQLDGLYRFNKDVAAGAYFSYGLGQAGSACTDGGVTCTTSVIRVGLQGTYTLNQVQFALIPWVGAGLGWERGAIKQEQGGLSQDTTFTGYELNLQVGGDYKVNDQFVVGPYLMLNFAQYGNFDSSGALGSSSGSIDNKAMHEWFGFGVRGKFSL